MLLRGMTRKGGGGVGGPVALEGAVAVMNACVLRRISEAELGGDPNADPSDSFAAALLSLAAGEGASTGGTGFSESAVRSCWDQTTGKGKRNLPQAFHPLAGQRSCRYVQAGTHTL